MGAPRTGMGGTEAGRDGEGEAGGHGGSRAERRHGSYVGDPDVHARGRHGPGARDAGLLVAQPPGRGKAKKSVQGW